MTTIRKILKSPSVKRKTKVVPLDERVTLEKVLGLTLSSNASLACDPNTGTIAYPAGCVVVLFDSKRHKQSHIINASKKTITTLAFSGDGKYIVTGESGHQPAVRVWEVEDKSQVIELHGHQFGINCVTFSPNLKYLVSVGTQHDMMVNVWNWKTGVKVASNKISSKVTSVSFACDGSYFVTVGNRLVKFWYLDLSKSKLKETVPLNGRSGLLADHKNNLFSDVACGRGKLSTRTYSITQSGLLCEFNSKRLLAKWVELRTTRASCLSIGDNQIYIGCANGTVRVFSAHTLDYITTLPRPHYLGVDIAAATEAAHMVSGDKDAKYPDVIAVILDDTNKKVTCVYNDHSLYIWDVHNLNKVGKAWSFLFHSSSIYDIKMYPDIADPLLPPSSFLTSSSDNTIRVWNLDPLAGETGVCRRNIFSNELFKVLYIDPACANLCDIDYNPAGTKDKTDINYDEKCGIRAICISPDGCHVASGDRVGNIRVHDVSRMMVVTTIEAHDAEVLTLEYSNFSAGPKLLATASRDRLIHIFDVEQNYGLIQTLDDHSASIMAVKFTEHNGAMKMLSCGADKSLLFRSAELEPTFQFTLNQHLVGKSTLCDMIVDPTRKFVATACQDRNIRIYNILTAKQKKMYKGLPSDDGVLIRLQLDPSGSYVATCGTDKNLCILDLYTGEVMAKMFGHSEVVNGLQFTNDCKHLISVGNDSCMFVWRLSSDMTKQMTSHIPDTATPYRDVDSMLADVDLRRGSFIMPKAIVFDRLDGCFPSFDDDDFKSPDKVFTPNVADPEHIGLMTPEFRPSFSQMPRWARNSGQDTPEHDEPDPRPRGRWAERNSVDIKSVFAGLTIERDSDAHLARELPWMTGSNTSFTITADDEDNVEDDGDFVPATTRSSPNGSAVTDMSESRESGGARRDSLRLSLQRLVGRRSADGNETDDEGDVKPLIYFPPTEPPTPDGHNTFKVFAITADELRQGKSKLRRSMFSADLGSDMGSFDSESTSTDAVSIEETLEEDDEEGSLPSTPMEQKSLPPSQENGIEDANDHDAYEFTPAVTHDGRVCESLSGLDDHVMWDSTGRVFSPRLSISARFLSRLDSSSRSLAKQDNWFDSVQKRKDEMARAVDETRRRLEALGWQTTNPIPSRRERISSHEPTKIAPRKFSSTYVNVNRGTTNTNNTNTNSDDFTEEPTKDVFMPDAAPPAAASPQRGVSSPARDVGSPRSQKPVPTVRASWSKVPEPGCLRTQRTVRPPSLKLEKHFSNHNSPKKYSKHSHLDPCNKDTNKTPLCKPSSKTKTSTNNNSCKRDRSLNASCFFANSEVMAQSARHCQVERVETQSPLYVERNSKSIKIGTSSLSGDKALNPKNRSKKQEAVSSRGCRKSHTAPTYMDVHDSKQSHTVLPGSGLMITCTVMSSISNHSTVVSVSSNGSSAQHTRHSLGTENNNYLNGDSFKRRFYRRCCFAKDSRNVCSASAVSDSCSQNGKYTIKNIHLINTIQEKSLDHDKNECIDSTNTLVHSLITSPRRYSKFTNTHKACKADAISKSPQKQRSKTDISSQAGVCLRNKILHSTNKTSSSLHSSVKEQPRHDPSCLLEETSNLSFDNRQSERYNDLCTTLEDGSHLRTHKAVIQNTTNAGLFQLGSTLISEPHISVNLSRCSQQQHHTGFSSSHYTSTRVDISPTRPSPFPPRPSLSHTHPYSHAPSASDARSHTERRNSNVNSNDADSGVSSTESVKSSATSRSSDSSNHPPPSPKREPQEDHTGVSPKPRKPRLKYTSRRHSTEPLFDSNGMDERDEEDIGEVADDKGVVAQSENAPTYQKLIQASRNLTKKQLQNSGKVYQKIREPLYLKQTKSSRAKISSNIDAKKERGHSRSLGNSSPGIGLNLSAEEDDEYDDDDDFDMKKSKREKGSKLSRSLCVSVPNLATCYEDDDEEIEEPSNLHDASDLSKSVPDLLDDDTSSCVSGCTTSSGFTERDMQLKVESKNKSASASRTPVKSPHPRRSIAPRKKTSEMTLEQAKNILLGRSGILNSKDSSSNSNNFFAQAYPKKEDIPVQKSSISLHLNVSPANSNTLPWRLNVSSHTNRNYENVDSIKSHSASRISHPRNLTTSNSLSSLSNIDDLEKENRGLNASSTRHGSISKDILQNSFSDDYLKTSNKINSVSRSVDNVSSPAAPSSRSAGKPTPNPNKPHKTGRSNSTKATNGSLSNTSTLTPESTSAGSEVLDSSGGSGPLTSTPHQESSKLPASRWNIAPSLRIQRKISQQADKQNNAKTRLSSQTTDSDGEEPMCVTPSQLKSNTGQVVLPWEMTQSSLTFEKEVGRAVKTSQSSPALSAISVNGVSHKTPGDEPSPSVNPPVAQKSNEGSGLSCETINEIGEAISTLKQSYLRVTDLCNTVISRGSDYECREIAKMLTENLEETQKSLDDLSHKLTDTTSARRSSDDSTKAVGTALSRRASSQSTRVGKKQSDLNNSYSVSPPAGTMNRSMNTSVSDTERMDRSMNTSRLDDSADMKNAMSLMEPMLQQYANRLMDRMSDLIQQRFDQ